MISKEDVEGVLNHLTEPLSGLSFIQAGLIKEIFVEENRVKIILQYPSPLYPYKEEVKKLIENEIQSLDISFEILIEEAGKEVWL